jgi:hypothetical protein
LVAVQTARNAWPFKSDVGGCPLENAQVDVKKKIVGPIPYYYDISNYYILLWSLPSKTSLFNEMAPAKKIYVTNGNTPRPAPGRQGTARRAKSTPLGHFDIL